MKATLINVGFTVRVHSDLSWLINGPELLALEDAFSAKQLLHQCQPTNNFEFKETHRLGVYFEQLWNHLVTNSHSLELAHHNLQIIIDKHTHGEFDSIIFDGQETIHCELAVKFYLNIGGGSQLSDWVGPNLKDRFDDKYQRLFNHQLALSKNAEVQAWLEQREITIDRTSLLCKGRLFYSYEDYQRQMFRFPNEVAQEHLKGFWIHDKDLQSLLTSNEYNWYQLPRFYWLSEIEASDNECQNELLPVEQNYSGYSLQKIVALNNGKEVMRGFVVNDDWLNKARQRVLD